MLDSPILRPDANTYGALLDGFARVGDDRSAAALYAALKRRGEGADRRGWSPSWRDDEEKNFSGEKDFSAERVCASARARDARARARRRRGGVRGERRPILGGNGNIRRVSR